MLQTYIFLAITIIAGAMGNVLIKLGTQRITSKSIDLAFLLSAVRNPYIIVGVLLLVGSFPFYTEVFVRMPLHIAMPVIAGSTFVLVDIASYFFLHETLTLLNVVGMLVVIIGLVLLSYK